MELLDAGVTVAADIKEAGEARLTGLYADWLRREADAGNIRLGKPEDEVASAITAALKGAKTDGSDYATIKNRIGVLSDLLGGGLAVS